MTALTAEACARAIIASAVSLGELTPQRRRVDAITATAWRPAAVAIALETKTPLPAVCKVLQISPDDVVRARHVRPAAFRGAQDAARDAVREHLRLHPPADYGPLTQPAEDVLRAMFKMAGERRTLIASFRALAEASGQPQGSMGFLLQLLQDHGRIVVTRRRKPSGRPDTNSYELCGDPPAAKTAPRVKASDKPQAALWEKVEPPKPAPTPKPAAPVVVAPVAPAPVEPAANLTQWAPLVAKPHSLLALTPGACRWPTNSPPLGRGDLTTFCCERTEEGESYCETHRRAARGQQGRVWTPEQRTEASLKARARASTRHALRRAQEAVR